MALFEEFYLSCMRLTSVARAPASDYSELLVIRATRTGDYTGDSVAHVAHATWDSVLQTCSAYGRLQSFMLTIAFVACVTITLWAMRPSRLESAACFLVAGKE